MDVKMRSLSFNNLSPRTQFYLGLLAANILTLGYIFGNIHPGELDTDGGIFAAIAYKELHGGTLYVDAYENKPPGIFYFLEIFLSLIPHKVYALYCFSAFNILALTNGLWLLAYRLLKSVWISLLILASFILLTVNNYFMSDGLYTEILGSAFMIWSLYTYHLYCDKGQLKYVYISALFIGTAVWLKEPFVFLAFPIAVMWAIKLKAVRAILKMLAVLLLPSFLFVLILWVRGSLIGFVEMELCNFGLTGTKKGLISGGQMEVLWGGVLHPLLIIVIMVLWYAIKSIVKRELRPIVLFNAILLLGSLCFIFVSPINYAHYYLPFTVLLFYNLISFSFYEQQYYSGSRILLTLLLVYSVWKLDQDYVRRFKISFKAYQPDSITETLRHNADATLFIDLSSASEYYIKSEKVFPAFMAIPIIVHFGNDAEGSKKLNRMYEELKTIRPDYLITNASYSEMYHRFPDQTLYTVGYEKKDSVVKYGETIFLWKRK